MVGVGPWQLRLHHKDEHVESVGCSLSSNGYVWPVALNISIFPIVFLRDDRDGLPPTCASSLICYSNLEPMILRVATVNSFSNADRPQNVSSANRFFLKNSCVMSRALVVVCTAMYVFAIFAVVSQSIFVSLDMCLFAYLSIHPSVYLILSSIPFVLACFDPLDHPRMQREREGEKDVCLYAWMDLKWMDWLMDRRLHTVVFCDDPTQYICDSKCCRPAKVAFENVAVPIVFVKQVVHLHAYMQSRHCFGF